MEGGDPYFSVTAVSLPAMPCEKKNLRWPEVGGSSWTSDLGEY